MAKNDFLIFLYIFLKVLINSSNSLPFSDTFFYNSNLKLVGNPSAFRNSSGMERQGPGIS
jgi:hypothetical protein